MSVNDEVMTAYLMDGRGISVPLEWSWRLAEATPEQRARFELIGDGHGVHWPEIDEDISAEGMLYGVPAPRPGHRFVRLIIRKTVPMLLGMEHKYPCHDRFIKRTLEKIDVASRSEKNKRQANNA